MSFKLILARHTSIQHFHLHLIIFPSSVIPPPLCILGPYHISRKQAYIPTTISSSSLQLHFPRLEPHPLYTMKFSTILILPLAAVASAQVSPCPPSLQSVYLPHKTSHGEPKTNKTLSPPPAAGPSVRTNAGITKQRSDSVIASGSRGCPVAADGRLPPVAGDGIGLSPRLGGIGPAKPQGQRRAGGSSGWWLSLDGQSRRGPERWGFPEWE